MGKKPPAPKKSASKAKKPKAPAAPPPGPVRQLELLPPVTKKDMAPKPRPPELPEIPPALPQSIPGPAEPVISAEIAVPPAAAFTQAFVEGSLARSLTQPDKSVARVVHSHYAKERYPWVTEWTGAAEAGDPCIRKLAYLRLTPEMALPDSEELSMLFKHGNWIEKEVLAEMAEAGYEVVEQQRPFVDRDLMVKGKIDGKLIVNFDGKRRKPPFEIKGYAPTTWNRVDSARDLLDSNASYLRKVPAQVMLYLLLDKEADSDAGILYMKNKLTGAVKTIIVPRDEQYATWLLNRLKVLREYVLRKELPPRIEFDEALCGKCPFRHVCLKEMPPGVNNPVVLSPDKQAMLLELLVDWWQLNPMRKQWKEVDDRISDIVRGHPKIILGDFIVTGKGGTQDRIDTKAMTEDHRKLYLKTSETWRKGIVNIKDQQGPAD